MADRSRRCSGPLIPCTLCTHISLELTAMNKMTIDEQRQNLVDKAGAKTRAESAPVSFALGFGGE